MKIKPVFFLMIALIFSLPSCSVFIPPKPVTVFPENCGTVFGDNVVLSWACKRDDVLFDVYFGESVENMRLVGDDIHAKELLVSGCTEYDRYYYWEVVSEFSSGMRAPGGIKCFLWRAKTDEQYWE